MNTQQAYINGFVKRANEHGLTEEEEAIALLSKEKNLRANVPLQTLFGGGLAGMGYNAYKDIRSPKGTPSRLLNIEGRGTLGGITGILAGAGLGYLGERSNLPSLGGLLAPAPMAAIGGLAGTMVGNNIGARRYNEKLEELERQRAEMQ